MIRLNLPVGMAALGVSVLSIFAPVDTTSAHAQDGTAALSIAHTQPSAEETVPVFIAREIVQQTARPAEPELAEQPKSATLAQLVATLPTQDTLDEQLECLAGAIYFEARGEPLAGQLAVGEVIVNRAASGRFPASYCGVVTQKSQFSFVKRGRIPAAPESSPLYRRARAIAQIAHRDLWSSEAKDALFFHARHVSPGWSGKRMAARIHNHVFYK